MISARSSSRMHVPEGIAGVRQTRSRRRGARRRSSELPSLRSQDRTLQQVLQDNSSALTFLGVTLGVFVSRKFLALPIAVALMMAQDSLGSAGLARATKAVRG